MNIVFAWMIVGAVVAAMSFVVPLIDASAGYWEAWRSWNLFIWSILLGALLVSLALTWAVFQLVVG